MTTALSVSSVLASLNLPAALEDLSGAKVPQSVTDKAKQIQDLGGVARIDSLIAGLPDLLTRNREILDEVGGYRWCCMCVFESCASVSEGKIPCVQNL